MVPARVERCLQDAKDFGEYKRKRTFRFLHMFSRTNLQFKEGFRGTDTVWIGKRMELRLAEEVLVLSIPHKMMNEGKGILTSWHNKGTVPQKEARAGDEQAFLALRHHHTSKMVREHLVRCHLPDTRGGQARGEQSSPKRRHKTKAFHGGGPRNGSAEEVVHYHVREAQMRPEPLRGVPAQLVCLGDGRLAKGSGGHF